MPPTGPLREPYRDAKESELFIESGEIGPWLRSMPAGGRRKSCEGAGASTRLSAVTAVCAKQNLLVLRERARGPRSLELLFFNRCQGRVSSTCRSCRSRVSEDFGASSSRVSSDDRDHTSMRVGTQRQKGRITMPMKMTIIAVPVEDQVPRSPISAGNDRSESFRTPRVLPNNSHLEQRL